MPLVVRTRIYPGSGYGSTPLLLSSPPVHRLLSFLLHTLRYGLPTTSPRSTSQLCRSIDTNHRSHDFNKKVHHQTFLKTTFFVSDTLGIEAAPREKAVAGLKSVWAFRRLSKLILCGILIDVRSSCKIKNTFQISILIAFLDSAPKLILEIDVTFFTTHI